MVLKAVILILVLCSFHAPLTEKYHKQVYKTIAKSFDSKNIELKKERFSRGELNQIIIDGAFKGYALVAEVAACNLGGCTSYEKVSDAKSSEYFDLLLVIDESNTIKSIKILDYFSDYGYEITSNSYLKKFKGKQICEFKNDADEIDAISGATISSFALEGMIVMLCNRLEVP